MKDGKRTIALNLKKSAGRDIARRICLASDVIIEPFRPGVMEKLELGPEELLNINPRLIYARLTGFGQSGIYAQRAGHDLNYVGLSGLLSFFGRKNEKPTAPVNFSADFAGGATICAFGILAALFERTQSGKGQIVDAAMVEGTAYIGSWLFKSKELPIQVCSAEKRGENLLDTGFHFYDTYETKDHKFVSVAAIEPQFYECLMNEINLFDLSDQLNESEEKKQKMTDIFKTKTRDEWTKIFDTKDACVFPVLTPEEAAVHTHNSKNQSFTVNDNGTVIPKPAPQLSRTPAKIATKKYGSEYEEVLEILSEIGLNEDKLKELYEDSILFLNESSKL